MFLLRRPNAAGIAAFIAEQSSSGFSYQEIGATKKTPPSNYDVDHTLFTLGQGSETFRRAKEQIRLWRMFDLGWASLFQPTTPIEPGVTVAVLFRHFGFWSLNAARIVYTFSEERRFGFAYGTLEDHAEMGEERFSVEWSPKDDSVTYEILAFSRPKQWHAVVGKPIVRALQKKFRRESCAAMRQGCV